MHCPVSACTLAVLREVRAMEGKTPHFPPSLNAVKSEYKIFCDRYGGPITCDDRFANIDFEYCCREFPRQMFEPIIGRWVTDPTHGIRHWPVMAFAASQYAFRQREFNKYGAELSPAQVRELLDEIRKSARRLRRALFQFQEMSARLSDGTVPLAVPHLSWLDQLIAQAMAGELAAEVSEERLAIVDSERSKFLRRLGDVEIAAEYVQDCLDPKLLRRGRTSENRALRTLVAMAKPIWQSLTGRKPSVNKVAGERESDFVSFVQELAKIAGGPEPTFKQVQTAFPVRTPD
jgi:CRISPR-associated DxTHG motif protein